MRNRSLSSRRVNDTALSRGRPERFRPIIEWHSAERGTTIVTGVSQWDDLSGTGNHLLQASGPAQPALTASSFGTKPALTGDGAAKYMRCTFAGSLSQPFTAAVVANPVNGGYQMDGIDTAKRMAIASDGSKVSVYAGTAFIEGGALTGPMTNIAVANGASSSMRTNGAAASSGSAGTNTLTGLTTFTKFDNSGSFLSGTIAELVLFNYLLSASQTARLESYLRRWGTW